MTELVYYEDAYVKSIEATVTAVDGNAVILDKTIFYPECGGQPGDRGCLGPYIIKDTQKGKDGTPLHIVEGRLPAAGEKLLLSLDWDHRYKYMKEHSAQHLISAVMFNEFSINTVAVHQGDKFLTIETDKSEIEDAVLLAIEDSVNLHVREGHRIYQTEVDHKSAENLNMRRSIKVDGDVKLVYIDGIDVVACGGVHAGNTRELGEIHYYGKEQIRGHVRTIWCVSGEAVADRRDNERALREACRLLSSTRDSLPSDIERLIAINNELKHSVRALSSKAAEREYSEASAVSSSLIAFSSELPLELFPDYLDPGREIFIVNGSAFLYQGTKDRFLRLKEALSLKGGGRDTLFRGSFTGSSDEVLHSAEAVLRD